MDNVILGADEPTEEEYCIGTFSPYGYYTGFVFPRNFDLYSDFLTFDKKPKDHKKWKKKYYYLVQMLTLGHKGKPLFLKNPTLSYRIRDILEMFPNAKFIFTYRDPYTLYTSMYKFWLKTCEIFSLQEFKEKYYKIKDGYLRLFNESLEKHIFEQTC